LRNGGKTPKQEGILPGRRMNLPEQEDNSPKTGGQIPLEKEDKSS